MADNRYKRLGKNTLLVFVGNAGSKLISLLLLPFYTHYLSTEEYGLSDIVNTYSAILLSIVTCCLADAIFIFPKDADEDGKKKFFSSGLFFSIISFVFFGCLFWIINCCGILGDLGSLSENIWWIFAMTASMFIQNYTQQFTRSIDRMVVYSASGAVLTLSLAVSAIFLIPKYGLNGYLFSIIISHFITAAFCIIASNSLKYINIKSFDTNSLKILLTYGIPLVPNSIMWWLVNGINRPIMENELGLSSIGIYAVANRIPGVITMLITIFSNAWGISMLEEFKKPDFNSFFNKTLKVISFAALTGGAVLMMFSKPIVKVFASSDYYSAWRYIPVLTLAVIIQSISSLVGGVFMAEKKSKYFFYSSIWGAISSLLFTIIFVKLWGIMGACIAVAGSFLCMTIARLIYAWKYINSFDIKYYTEMFILFIILIIAISIDINILFIILLFFTIITIMIVLNKQEVISIVRLLMSYLKKK